MIGQYAVRDISLSITSRDGAAKAIFLPSTDAGIEMDSPLGTPLQWARSGTRAQLAQVVALPDGKHALALVDNSAKTLGAWILKPAYCSEVREGDEIILNWSECFSLGRGGQGGVAYQNLPPGDYSLLVAGQTLEGSSIARRVIQAFRNPFRAHLPETLGRTSVLEKISPREREILELLAKGYLQKEIADQLGVSFSTVRTLTGRIYEKLHVHSRGQAVAKYLGAADQGA